MANEEASNAKKTHFAKINFFVEKKMSFANFFVEVVISRMLKLVILTKSEQI